MNTAVPAVEQKLLLLVEDLAPVIGRDEEVESLINQHGEYGVAPETICAIIEEKQVAISRSCFDDIFAAAKLMEFEDSWVDYYMREIKIKN
ncbi:MAG TPA: MafI family immunity protein [Allocoleopsis sp.]